MSVAWPNDAYSAKMTATLESKDQGTLPGKHSDMNVQATKDWDMNVQGTKGSDRNVQATEVYRSCSYSEN